MHFDFARLVRLPNFVESNRYAVRRIAHGRRRGPLKGFVAVVSADEELSVIPVTTRSPSFKPSRTSVVMPSLIPVLIVVAVGFDAPEARTNTVRSVRLSARFPPGL